MNKIVDEVEAILKATLVVALYVMHINPKFAEDYLYLDSVAGQTATNVYDQWIRFVPSDGSQSWYMMHSRNGAGVHRNELPSDVDPKTVVGVRYQVRSEQERPVLSYLLELENKLDAIKSHAPVDAALLKSIDGLEEIIRSVDACYDPLYFTHLWSTYGENFVESIGHQGVYADPQSFLAALFRQTQEQYAGFKVTGDLLAAVLSFWEICQRIEESSRASLANYKEGSNFMQYAQLLFALPLDEYPRARVSRIVEKGTREGFLATILNVAENLATQGDKLIDAAKQSEDVPHFYTTLFDAVPFFFAPHTMYQSLLESTDNAVRQIHEDAHQLESLKKARNVCEEKFNDICGSLKNAVANLDGSQLDKHISEVQQARAEGGNVAAELKASEFIDFYLFYPNSVRKTLLGA